jgi:outer membrane autotransporter protein
VQTGNSVVCSGQSTSDSIPLASVVSGGTISIEGRASITGETYSGILGIGERISLSNGGSLSTTGASADVMEVVGNGGSIVNRGEVSSQGVSADALRAVGNGNTVVNAGGITTSGPSARALYGEGDANALTNRGTVTTNGAGAEGIRAKGNGNTLVNENLIVTSGNVGNGVRASGNRNTLVNGGTITTSGVEARGIKVDAGTGNAVTNRGTIRTNGSAAEGIWVSSATGQETNLVNEASGVIETGAAEALRFEDGNERFENFGRIAARNGVAGRLGGGDDRFLIGSMSHIEGVVDAGSGTDTFALGGDTNAAFDASLIGPDAQYRSFERYEKVGASTWTVTGSNGTIMPWDVRAGTLMIVGSMGGSGMLVHPRATLGGSGTVGSISTRPGSTLTPGVGGIGVLTVTGDVVIANGTIYRIDLDADRRSDRIVAGGKATVRGGRVVVDALPGDYRPGSRWTILTARGGVTGQFSSVTTNLAFFRPVLAKDDDNIHLTLPLERPTGMPADRPIIEPFLPVMQEELPYVLQVTSGEPLVSATGIILGHDDLFRAAVLCRLRCSAGGLPTFATLDGVQVEYMADMPESRSAAMAPVAPTPDRPSDWAFWGKAIGSWGSTGATARTAAVDRSTAGFVLGIDGGFGTPYRFGVAAGYFMTGFDVAALSSAGMVESVHVGAYGAASFGAFTLRGGVAYGRHEVDMLRAIAFTGFAGTNLSSSETQSMQAFGEIGYAIALNERIAVEPFAGLAHVHIDSRAIIEEGSAVAVTGEAHSFDTTYATLGARLVATLPTSAGLLTFKGLLGWRHAFGDTVPEATFSYASGSTPFLVAGAPIDRDSLVMEAGVNWAASEKVTLGVSYTGAVGARDQEHTVRASLSVRF